MNCKDDIVGLTHAIEIMSLFASDADWWAPRDTQTCDNNNSKELRWKFYSSLCNLIDFCNQKFHEFMYMLLMMVERAFLVRYQCNKYRPRERDELRWCIWKPIKLHSLDISGLENKGPHWCRIVIIINIAEVISPWNSRIQVFFIENIAVMNHSHNYKRHGINFYDE